MANRAPEFLDESTSAFAFDAFPVPALCSWDVVLLFPSRTNSQGEPQCMQAKAREYSEPKPHVPRIAVVSVETLGCLPAGVSMRIEMPSSRNPDPCDWRNLNQQHHQLAGKRELEERIFSFRVLRLLWIDLGPVLACY